MVLSSITRTRMYSPLARIFRRTVTWLWQHRGCPRAVEAAQSNCIPASRRASPIFRTRGSACVWSRNSPSRRRQSRRSLAADSSPVVCDTSGTGNPWPARLALVSGTLWYRIRSSSSRECCTAVQQGSLADHWEEIRIDAIVPTVYDNKRCTPARSRPRVAARRSRETDGATIPGRMARFGPAGDRTRL